MTEETDIITLLRILLARRPSESALEDLVKKPLDQTLLRTLAVDEFANNVLEPMLNDGVMLHDKKNIKLTQADLLWISEHYSDHCLFKKPAVLRLQLVRSLSDPSQGQVTGRCADRILRPEPQA